MNAESAEFLGLLGLLLEIRQKTAKPSSSTYTPRVERYLTRLTYELFIAQDVPNTPVALHAELRKICELDVEEFSTPVMGK